MLTVTYASPLSILSNGPRTLKNADSGLQPPALPKMFLSDLSGSPVMISQLEGHPLLVINFLATWCGPCMDELPSLLQLARISRGHVSVTGILEGRAESGKLISLLRKYRGEFQLLKDPDMKLSSALHVVALPTSFIVDSRGQIVSKVSGAVRWTDPKVIDYLKSFISSKAGF
jgi:thiol-disulfide isomerase/thioredoxin